MQHKAYPIETAATRGQPTFFARIGASAYNAPRDVQTPITPLFWPMLYRASAAWSGEQPG
ncbi:MAG: hypothetical protein KJ063_11810 [Anaerolineae bacterium]|nr:hypothetical protein [Anaerolineae bacterium]